MIETEPSPERVVLVGAYNDGIGDDTVRDDLDELELLVRTAGGEVAGRLIQRRRKPDPATFLGKGKVEELGRLVSAQDAATVIFDDDLKPSQGVKLTAALGGDVKVLDRTALILDIFASRARTAEARLQVELAQLQYILPRLAGLWGHLERQKGGIGLRGPGEKQIESDRRLVRKRISVIKEKLEQVAKEREVQRAHRRNLTRVAIVGYTNAGKSTLLNSLTGADVMVEDMLFATLDATTRKLQDSPRRVVLLTDTVGFIRKLPHHLVDSFRSTLNETRDADLLCLVVDASHPALEAHIETANSVMRMLGAEDTPTYLVMNKVDILSDEDERALRRNYPDALFISAKAGRGIDELRGKLLRFSERKTL